MPDYSLRTLNALVMRSCPWPEDDDCPVCGLAPWSAAGDCPHGEPSRHNAPGTRSERPTAPSASEVDTGKGTPPEEALSRGEAWLILGLLALVLGLPEEALSTVEAVLMVGLLLLAVGLRCWRG
jgi:hypothetical protein